MPPLRPCQKNRPANVLSPVCQVYEHLPQLHRANGRSPNPSLDDSTQSSPPTKKFEIPALAIQTSFLPHQIHTVTASVRLQIMQCVRSIKPARQQLASARRAGRFLVDKVTCELAGTADASAVPASSHVTLFSQPCTVVRLALLALFAPPPHGLVRPEGLHSALRVPLKQS